MNPVLETDRLFLRKFYIKDAESFYLLNSNPIVMQYTGDKRFLDIQDAQEFLLNYSHYSINGFGRWSVLRKSDNQFVGWSGLKRNENNDIDLGFRFFQEEWNKGYATESAMACLEYGFNSLGFRRIIGRAHKNNKASIRVLEKIGMTYLKNENAWRHFEINHNT